MNLQEIRHLIEAYKEKLKAIQRQQLAPISQPNIYHYCSAETALLIIKGRRIWASDYLEMNDPKELRHGIDLMRKLVDAHSNPKSIRHNAVWSLWNDLIAHGIPDLAVMISSLSLDFDSLDLWRAYGANGTGCAVGLNPSVIEQDVAYIDSFISGAHIIFYDDDALAREQLGIIEATNNFLSEALTDQDFRSFSAMDGKEFLGIIAIEAAFGCIWNSVQYKSRYYRSEQEARISIVTQPENLTKSGLLKHRQRASKKIGYLELSLDSVDGKSALSEIVLGPAISQHHEKMILVELEQGQVGDIRIHRSGIRYRPD